MAFTIPQKLTLACLPTPIKKLERLSAHLGGPAIFVKRDDLTGAALSGNKIRKLEFVIKDAIDKGCDTLITTGGLGSNHARATAVAARQLGLHPFLVLRGSPGPAADGNLLLNTLLDAEIKFISRADYENRDEIMAEAAEDLRKKGRRPYIIPEGASNALGAWGYFEAAKEIKSQIEQYRLPSFDAVIVPVGSGGTYAGFADGSDYYGLHSPLYGVNVSKNAAFFIDRITMIMHSFRQQFHYPKPVPADNIHIIDGYTGKGYALSSTDELETIRLVAGLEGIFLDPVYTGKAMHGLIGQIQSGRFTKKMNLLFIHTGGIFGLFPKRQIFAGGTDAGEFYEKK